MVRNFISFLADKQVKTWQRNRLIKDVESGKLKVVPSDHKVVEPTEVAPTQVKPEPVKEPDTSHLDSLEGLAIPKGVEQPFKIGQVLDHDSPTHKGKVRFVIAFDSKTPVVQDLETKKSFPTKLNYLS